MIKFIRNRCKKIVQIFFILLISAPSLVWAASSSISIDIRVRVQSPTCIVNGNRVINVNFGNDLGTHLIDGKNYSETLDYDIDCPDASSNNMRIKVGGIGSSFETKYLETNNPDLGIVFYNGANQLDLNQWLSFSYPNKPEIVAIPIKKNNISLSGGAFIASATLYIEYQ